MLTLVSGTGERFTIPREVSTQATLFKTTLEGDRGCDTIELGISSEVTNLVVRYLTHHFNNEASEIERPLRSNDIRDVASTFDVALIDVDDDFLFEIIGAADYLDLRGLLDLAVAKLATILVGKSAEQIRSRFEIENDLSEEDNALIRKEAHWANSTR